MPTLTDGREVSMDEAKAIFRALANFDGYALDALAIVDRYTRQGRQRRNMEEFRRVTPTSRI